MSAVAEDKPGVMYKDTSSELHTTTTTLFDLIATLQDQTAPDEDELVTAVVVDLCNHGHLHFVAPRAAGDTLQHAYRS